MEVENENRRPRGRKPKNERNAREVECDEYEARFQRAWAMKEWDTIWDCVYKAAFNILKKIQIGHMREDLPEIALDATINQIQRMKNSLVKNPDLKIGKLVTYIYLGVYFTLRNPKRAFEDSFVQFEEEWEGGIGT